MSAAADEPRLAACPCCGLVQHLPPMRPGQRARCYRCHTTLRRARTRLRARRVTAALALAALLLFPVAIGLPMLRVERFGHLHEASVWQGSVSLLSEGHLLVGTVVLLCSIVLPLGKLLTLLVLAGGGAGLGHGARARAWHLVEWAGRWGMLDVLLVAILAATLKLGDVVDLSAGPGALAFTTCVLLNLAASASFDPHDLWEAPA